MPLPAPRGIIFDFGDTLMREGPLDLAAGASRVLALARETGGCSPERLAAAFADLLADLDPRRRSSLLEPPPDTVWRLVFDPLGLRFDASAEEVEWAFWNAAIPWTPEPGVAEVVHLLTRARLPCGVLSNTMFRGRVLERQLIAAGLRDPFRVVMTSADFVLRKPHPRLFTLAAGHLGVDPRHTWFVGDSFEADVRGAAEAGMVPIWYHPNGATDPPEPAAGAVAGWSAFRELLAASLGREPAA